MDAKITESALIALAGLIGVVALLFLTITRFKWHVFIAVLAPILLFVGVAMAGVAAYVTLRLYVRR